MISGSKINYVVNVFSRDRYIDVNEKTVNTNTEIILVTDIFFVIKPIRCTNFTNLFCHETLHVSDISSVHHQESIQLTLRNGICHTGL